MRGRSRQGILAALAAVRSRSVFRRRWLLGTTVGHTGDGDDHGQGAHKSGIEHVLLISVDGMHQSDLDWYVANHPDSELAKLASGGAEFTNNHTSDPSDSDPGGTALMTGGDPRATGVYYDVEYSHARRRGGRRLHAGPAGDRWRRHLRLAGRHAQRRA